MQGAGELCLAPCLPGRVRCPEHGGREEALAAHQLLDVARQRVLLRLEEQAEELADALVSIATDTEVDASDRVAALNTAFKVLALDKVQVQVEVGASPGKAARDARLLDLLERAGGGERAATVRSALGIVEAVARG